MVTAVPHCLDIGMPAAVSERQGSQLLCNFLADQRGPLSVAIFFLGPERSIRAALFSLTERIRRTPTTATFGVYMFKMKLIFLNDEI